MYVCVQCGHSVPYLYREFSAQNLRLAACAKCHQIADKYIEWETQMVLIDLILNKPEAYRHILFNRGQAHKMTREIIKFLLVIFAFDSFDRWYLNSGQVPLPNSAASVVASPVGVFTQWLLPHDHQWSILMTSVGETAIYIGSIFVLTRVHLHANWGKYNYTSRSLLSAIVLSCFSKLGVLLWMVWDAQSHHRVGIELFTLLSNLVAVTVFIGNQPVPSTRVTFPAVLIVSVAFLFRTLFGFFMSQMEPAIHFNVF
jgi:hypothetical protein